MLQTNYSPSNNRIQAYERDGHILHRNVASREEADSFGPLIQDVVRKAAKAKAPSAKSKGFAPFFTQITNVWRKDGGCKWLCLRGGFARLRRN